MGYFKSKKIEPEQMPAFSPEFQEAASTFGKMLNEYLQGLPEGLDTYLGEGWDYGPSEIGPAGIEALGRLRTLSTRGTARPEETRAADYLGRLLSGASREEGQKALAKYGETGKALAEALLRGQESRIGGKFARAGSTYGAGATAEKAKAAENIGTALANTMAEAGMRESQFARGQELAGAPMLAAIGRQIGQRGTQNFAAELGRTRQLLQTGELQSELQSELARRRTAEKVRSIEYPGRLLALLSQALGGGRAGEAVSPQYAPSGFSQDIGGIGALVDMIFKAFPNI